MGSAPSSVTVLGAQAISEEVVSSESRNSSVEMSEPAVKSIEGLEDVASVDDSPDNSSDSDGELSIENYNDPESIKDNWENVTRVILFKAFFSLEQIRDVNILTVIQNGITVENWAPTAKFVSVAVEFGLLEICVRLLEAPFEEVLASKNFYTLSRFMTIIWNCCDQTMDMGREVFEKRLHDSIVKNLEKASFDVQILSTLQQSGKIFELCRPMLSVLYNAIRHNPDFKQQMRENGSIELCQKFLHCDVPEIKTIVLFTLAFSADISNNKDLIADTSSSIKFIAESLLEPAIESKKHMSNGDDGWSVQEILQGTALLAENSQNAVQMADVGMLQKLEDLLGGSGRKEEIEPCLDNLFAMSFHPEMVNRIKNKTGLLSKMESLKLDGESNMEHIKELVSRIRWKINQSDNALTPQKENNKANQHIMISYCHKQQLIAWDIKKNLEQHEKKVWIDKTHIHCYDSILEAMASAVDNSYHVICCISKDYAESDNCKMEYTYACEKKKPITWVLVDQFYKPDGTLKLCMKGALYHTYFSVETQNKSFPNILDRVNGRFNEGNIEIGQTNSLDAADGRGPFSGPEQPPNKTCRTWLKKDVKEWFHEIGCSSNTEKTLDFVNGMDGKLLYELCCWQRNSLEFFLKFASEHLDLASLDLVRFSHAISVLSEK